jgi:hypothetical protein
VELQDGKFDDCIMHLEYENNAHFLLLLFIFHMLSG